VIYSVFVIIPVKNEAQIIQAVIDQFKIFNKVEILVVDDHSHDDTLKVLSEIQANYIENQFDPGREGAVKTGLAHYNAFRNDDWIVIFDGDGQHSISFINYIQKKKSSNIIFKGNRFSDRSEQVNTPPDRVKLANYLENYLLKYGKITVHDVNCGLLGLPGSKAAWILANCIFDKHFSVEISIIAKLDWRLNCQLIEIPIPAIYYLQTQKHIWLYQITSPAVRFELRKKSIVQKINDILSSLANLKR